MGRTISRNEAMRALSKQIRNDILRVMKSGEKTLSMTIRNRPVGLRPDMEADYIRAILGAEWGVPFLLTSKEEPTMVHIAFFKDPLEREAFRASLMGAPKPEPEDEDPT